MVDPPELGDNHSSLSGIEIKKELRCDSTPHILFGVHRDNSISTLNIARVLKSIYIYIYIYIFFLSEPTCRYKNSVLLGCDAAFLGS